MPKRNWTQEQVVVWTKADVQALLNSIQKNIQKPDERTPYTKGKKKIDWTKVSFRSFSAEICRRKWEDIEKKIQKPRTLTELIKEAEGAIEAPSKRKDLSIHPDFPKKPKPPNTIFFEKKQAEFARLYSELSKSDLMKLVDKTFKNLPEHKKAKYITLFQLATEEYKQKKKLFRKQYCRGKDAQGLSHKKSLRKPTKPVANKKGCSGKRKIHFECEPKKPPRSSFAVYCSEAMERLKDKVPNAKERLIMISPLWRNLPDSEKERYKKMAQDKMREYPVKLQEWLRTLSKEDEAIYREQNADKLKFLEKKAIPIFPREDARKDRPSDSEDENIEDTTSEEDDSSELDEEEDDDDNDEEDSMDDTEDNYTAQFQLPL